MHAPSVFFTARKRRRERMLRKMANMRSAKERKRLERGPRDDEPKFVRTTGLSWAVRDDLTGEICWLPLKSARDTFRRVTVLLKYYRA